VNTVRVVVVSDTHLSLVTPEAGANWDSIVRYVTEERPDLVIHLGDLTLDGSHSDTDLRLGRRQLDRLPVPWHAVPGNHDAGDNPGPGVPADYAVTSERRERWLDIIGPDHWSLDTSGWTLVAFNAQLFGSGLPAEAAQWAWLEQQLGELRDGTFTALVSHKPVSADAEEIAAAPPQWFIPEQARDRLSGLLGGRPPELVLSGHLHQQRLLQWGGTEHIWAPPAWAVMPDGGRRPLGAKRCGIVSLELTDSAAVRSRFIEPDGMMQLTLTRDIPDPYRH
jgi:3',5'-cyclic AMP phosphodiesterase CpdA